MHSKILSGVLLAASAVLAGCAGGGYVAAYQGPPPPRYGVVGVAPGPGYIWTDGWYDLHGHNWVWMQGRWVRPPRRGSVYVRPEWRREGDRWRFHRGYWR